MVKTEKPFIFVVAVALVNEPVRHGQWHGKGQSKGQGKGGEILLAQRPHGKSMAGLWEFPGGKVEPNELPEQALIRELKEELSITVDACDLQPLTFVSHDYDDFVLFMPLYLCDTWLGEPQGIEGQNLAWVAPHDLESYDMPPADVPLIRALKKL